MTVNEAAAYLKVDRTTLYAYCRHGLLRFYEMPMGRGRRFRQEDLDAVLTRNADRDEEGRNS